MIGSARRQMLHSTEMGSLTDPLVASQSSHVLLLQSSIGTMPYAQLQESTRVM